MCPTCKQPTCETCLKTSLCPSALGRRYKLGVLRRLNDIDKNGRFGLVKERTGTLSRIDLSRASDERPPLDTLEVFRKAQCLDKGAIIFKDSSDVWVLRDGQRSVIFPGREHQDHWQTIEGRLFVDAPHVLFQDALSIRTAHAATNKRFEFASRLAQGDHPTETWRFVTAAAFSPPGHIHKHGLIGLGNGNTFELFSFIRDQSFCRRVVTQVGLNWIGFDDNHGVWLIDGNGVIVRYRINDLGTDMEHKPSVRFQPSDAHKPSCIYKDFASLSRDLLVVAENPRRIVVRRAPSMEKLQEFNLPDKVRLLRFVADGQALVIADNDSYIYVLRRNAEGIDFSWNDHELQRVDPTT